MEELNKLVNGIDSINDIIDTSKNKHLDDLDSVIDNMKDKFEQNGLEYDENKSYEDNVKDASSKFDINDSKDKKKFLASLITNDDLEKLRDSYIQVSEEINKAIDQMEKEMDNIEKEIEKEVDEISSNGPIVQEIIKKQQEIEKLEKEKEQNTKNMKDLEAKLTNATDEERAGIIDALNDLRKSNKDIDKKIAGIDITEEQKKLSEKMENLKDKNEQFNNQKENLNDLKGKHKNSYLYVSGNLERQGLHVDAYDREEQDRKLEIPDMPEIDDLKKSKSNDEDIVIEESVIDMDENNQQGEAQFVNPNAQFQSGGEPQFVNPNSVNNQVQGGEGSQQQSNTQTTGSPVSSGQAVSGVSGQNIEVLDLETPVQKAIRFYIDALETDPDTFKKDLDLKELVEIKENLKKVKRKNISVKDRRLLKQSTKAFQKHFKEMYEYEGNKDTLVSSLKKIQIDENKKKDEDTKVIVAKSILEGEVYDNHKAPLEGKKYDSNGNKLPEEKRQIATSVILNKMMEKYPELTSDEQKELKEEVLTPYMINSLVYESKQLRMFGKGENKGHKSVSALFSTDKIESMIDRTSRNNETQSNDRVENNSDNSFAQDMQDLTNDNLNPGYENRYINKDAKNKGDEAR